MFNRELRTHFRPFHRFNLIVGAVNHTLGDVPSIPAMIARVPVTRPVVPGPGLQRVVQGEHRAYRVGRASSRGLPVHPIGNVTRVLVNVFMSNNRYVFRGPVIQGQVNEGGNKFQRSHIQTSFAPLFKASSFYHYFLFTSQLAAPGAAGGALQGVHQATRTRGMGSNRTGSYKSGRGGHRPGQGSPQGRNTRRGSRDGGRNTYRSRAGAFLRVVLKVRGSSSLGGSSSVAAFQGQSHGSTVHTVDQSCNDRSP